MTAYAIAWGGLFFASKLLGDPVFGWEVDVLRGIDPAVVALLSWTPIGLLAIALSG